MASFSRLILLDERGTGLSDPVPRDAPPTLERRMDDVRAVMGAVGSSQAAFLGGSEGGLTPLLRRAAHNLHRCTSISLVAFGDAKPPLTGRASSDTSIGRG